MFKVENERGITERDVMENSSITLKAKGLFGYLMSRNEGEHVTLDGIVENVKESTPAVRSAIKELEAAGYLVRKLDNSSGHAVYDWIVKM